MIYEYRDLKNVVKVGDSVKAVLGKDNPCQHLNDDGSNTQLITSVYDSYFCIKNCAHCYISSYFLDLIPQEKTLENLERGDILVDGDGEERKVLAVVGDLFAISCFNDFNSFAMGWFTLHEIKNNHWTLKQPTPPTPTADTIEIEGKKYNKSEVTERLSELKEVV